MALIVEDDGPGIAPDDLERIFQRFYRVEGGQASGSGLGLAIARELAGRMNGAVTVSSRPGATTFMLDLPAESAMAARARRRRRLTHPPVSTWKRRIRSVSRFHVETPQRGQPAGPPRLQ